MGRHVYTYVKPVREQDIVATCELLRNDGVIAYPSDVNWAFACDGSSPKALERIRLLKPYHPKDQPFSLLCASISMASSVSNVDDFAYSHMRRCCPGPFTFLLDRSKNFPRLMKDKRRTVGIRIPDSPLIQAVIELFGKPIATTGVPPCIEEGEDRQKQLPRFGYQVHEVFGHAVDLTLDLGEESPAGESTIVSLVDGMIEVVREGMGALSCLGFVG